MLSSEARPRLENFIRTGDLFEDLQHLLGCVYISDINHERYGREVAFALISPILTDYSAGQWLDMLHYLGFGQCDGIEDERDAKRFLQERVKEWPADDL